jgi:hypothetical protein
MRGYSKSPLWCVGVGEDSWQAGKAQHSTYEIPPLPLPWMRMIRSDLSRSVITEIAVDNLVTWTTPVIIGA